MRELADAPTSGCHIRGMFWKPSTMFAATSNEVLSK